VLVSAAMFGFIWRAALRVLFTAREYGLAQGLHAVLRIPVANVIAIMSGRRALAAYLRSLGGRPVTWDKTVHSTHPAFARSAELRT
jgi:adsorption protein B